MSPRKVRPVADLAKGLPVEDAVARLSVCVKKPAEALAKLISSAAANAENNFDLDKNALFVKNITVNEGMTLKRWMPRAHGRATRILKRMANITVVLENNSNEQSTTGNRQSVSVPKKQDAESRKRNAGGVKTKVSKKKEVAEEAKAEK